MTFIPDGTDIAARITAHHAAGQVCQGCGATIALGVKVVRVSYGTLYATAHPHWNVRRAAEDDYFHSGCPVAIREYIKHAEDVAALVHAVAAESQTRGVK
jgi:hypothetical protein